jgi:hypothetical protein
MSNTIITEWIFLVNPTPLAYKRRGRGGLDPTDHNTTDAHMMKGFYPHEARTWINPRVSCILLFSTSVSTPTLKSSHKP